MLRSHRTTRRGLSVLELLVALAVVLSIIAIVVPNMMGRLSENEFENFGETMRNHLLMARAHALQTGEPVEVRFVPDETALDAAYARMEDQAQSLSGDEAPVLIIPGRIESRRFLLDSGWDFAAYDPRESNVTEADLDGEDPDEDARILEPWALASVPGEISIVGSMPDFMRDRLREQSSRMTMGDAGGLEDSLDALDDESWFDESDEAMNIESDAEPLRIAVFLPDGSTLLGRTCFVIDRDRRCASIDINPWSGEAVWERIDRTFVVPSADSADDDDEEAMEEDDEFPDEDEFERSLNDLNDDDETDEAGE